MDRDDLKLLLESYRPQDGDDPIFEEALRQVADDPELRTWFEEMQHLDSVITSKLQEADVPADVKSHILRGYPADVPVPAFSYRRRGALAGVLVAILLATSVSWYFVNRQREMSPLEMQAITFTDHMPALQFVCFDPTAVATWINDQSDSKKAGIQLPMPKKALSMKMIGASVVKWNNRPVVMICLQDGKRMAMLYVLDAKAAEDFRGGAVHTVQHGDWVVRTSKEAGQVRILAAKGSPEDLDFPMPFAGV